MDQLVRGQRRMSAYRSLLRNRNYRWWFGTAFFAGLADWTGLVALQVLVTTLTEPGSRLSLFALGGVMMARLVPSLLLGPVAGVVADRYDRKRLMVVTNLVRGVLYIAVATTGSLVSLFALVFIVETMSLLYLSSKDASLPGIVRRDSLTQANQLNLLVTYGTLPLGALAASLMIPVSNALRAAGLTQATPPLIALLLSALAFMIAGMLLTRVTLPAHGRQASQAESPDGAGVLAELREGLRFIRDLPLIRSLILGVVGVFFSGGVVITLGPAFVGTALGGAGPEWFTMMTVVGIGLVLGLGLVPVVLRVIRKEKAFPLALALTALLAGVMATVSSFEWALVLAGGLGACVGFSFVLGYTLLHEYTDDNVRARTFATFYTVTRISMFTALGVTPFVAGAVGRGAIILGDWQFIMSGIRLTILAAAVFALFSAWTAGRGMFAALRTVEPAPEVRLKGGVAAPPRAGLFVAFEGVEGAGKSTQVDRLAEQLRREGHEVVVTREPGGAPVAERIRGLLLDPNSAGLDARTEALLYAAARVEHVQHVIMPALEEGKVVVCDRFIDSSLAYQGYARGLGVDEVFEINRWAVGGLLPDVVILLYLDAEEGLRRVAERARAREPRHLRPADGGGWEETGDRIEQEDLAFHQSVARGFVRLAKRDRRRFRIVAADAEPDTIARQVRMELHDWLPLTEDTPGLGGRKRAPDQRGTRPEAAG